MSKGHNWHEPRAGPTGAFVCLYENMGVSVHDATRFEFCPFCGGVVDL